MKRGIFIGIVFLFLISGQVFAQEEGYLIQLKEHTVLPRSAQTALELLYKDTRLYYTEDPGTVSWLERAEAAEFIKKDIPITLYGEAGYHDPFFVDNTQWGLEETGIPALFSTGIRGEGVRIAVLDSGLNPSHPDLDYSRVETGYNMINKNMDTTDSLGHGSFVTGIIAAQADNGIGIAGIADKATIVPLKCFDDKKGSLADAVAALDLAVNQYRCDVINMSFGVNQSDLPDSVRDQLYKIMADIAGRGVILIAAAGNDGDKTAEYSYPAAFDCVISVGAVDRQKKVAEFSRKNDSVWVSAPGVDMKSLGKEGDDYRVGRGTSFSAPMVSGVAACLKEKDPGLNMEKLLDLLQGNSQDLGVSGYDSSYGWGLLRADWLFNRIAGTEEKEISFSMEGVEDEQYQVTIPARQNQEEAVVLAVYDEERLETIKVILVKQEEQAVSIELGADRKLKRFVWDLEAMRPVAPAREIKKP